MQKKLGAISVRLTEDQHAGLAQLGASLGTDSAQLVRWAVDGLLNYAKAHDGRLHLPLDFTTAWTRLRDMVDLAERERMPDNQAHDRTTSRLNEEEPRRSKAK